MKRAAESELEKTQLDADPCNGSKPGSKPGSNPFAGISLFGSGNSATTLTFRSPATGFSSPAPTKESSNPFMGLSLFSSPASGEKFFTAAVTTLQKHASDGGLESAKADLQEEKDREDETQDSNEANEPDADGEAAGDEPTGEEDEEVIFRADCKLWKLVKAHSAEGDSKSEGWRWQERGCGIVHINRHKTTGAGRLVMRMRGVLKLLLNTPIFPTTRYEKVGQKSVRFVGVDTEESSKEVSFCAFRLNLHSSDQQGKFLAVMRDAIKD
mmetsp:Transcript_106944/g.130427  ORF Transcript_106944/g.130427 Transcript_106944/m.130427 type:complete len:269 (+) Transcript_106944:56-862(+)